MTDTIGIPLKAEDLLGKLQELDHATLATISQDQAILDQLKKDNHSMRMIEETVRKSLTNGRDVVFAEQLRQVFGLNFLTLLSINPTGMGKDWFKIVTDMIDSNSEGFATWMMNWAIPDVTVKFYGLNHLFSDGVEISDEAKRRNIMQVTGITEEAIDGYREELIRKGTIKAARGVVKAAALRASAPVAEA